MYLRAAAAAVKPVQRPRRNRRAPDRFGGNAHEVGDAAIDTADDVKPRTGRRRQVAEDAQLHAVDDWRPAVGSTTTTS